MIFVPFDSSLLEFCLWFEITGLKKNLFFIVRDSLLMLQRIP